MSFLLAGCGYWPIQGNPESVRRTAGGAPDLSGYRIGVGDRLRIDVYGEADLSLDAQVDPTGRFGYPLLGSVEALNKTAIEIQGEVRRGLAGGYLVNPDVRVTVVQYRPFYVIGQVRKAGAYPYVNGLTVEKALALAGGLTNIASTRHIYVLREDNSTDQRQKASMDSLVLPGDTLLVEESLF